jgi:[ribosomal protein S5]-alanine N-acetyltransferase
MPAPSTARLRLPLWTAEDVAAIRTGERRPEWHPQFPREDDRDAASLWRPDDAWSTRSVVSALHDRMVVGSIGFYGPPSAGADDVREAEVGYGLVEAARGSGLMTEALTLLLESTDGAGVRVRASVLPGNQASIRVLAKCGFTELRGTTEDGELVMVRPLR